MSGSIHLAMADGVARVAVSHPGKLNAMSRAMWRELRAVFGQIQQDASLRCVVVHGPDHFCAGGDIRFFHQAGTATPQAGSALLEDFFSEEYALNHLIHFYPKPFIALLDGIVMGGGMGIAQSGPQSRLRLVTERTKMAMPEVNIGLFPDVGGSYFLSRAPGQLGTYLGVTGAVIGAADALAAQLADVFVPGAELTGLQALITKYPGAELRQAIDDYCKPFAQLVDPSASRLTQHRDAIDLHFSGNSVADILQSLAQDHSDFARQTLALMAQRSPLMMSVTLAQLRRGGNLSVADCLRMERTMVRRAFEHGEVLEGVRAVVIDKDNQPKWQPATLAEVTDEMVARFFVPAWPPAAHPLRDLP